MGPHQPVEDSGAVTAHGRVAVKGEEHVTLSAELAHKALGLAPLGGGEQVSASRRARGHARCPPTLRAGSGEPRAGSGEPRPAAGRPPRSPA